MATTYTTSLTLSKQGDGDNNTTWGQVANGVFDLLDTAIAGMSTKAMADADQTLTATVGAANESRAAILKLTGTLTAARNVIVPTQTKLYVVHNACTGYAVTVKTASGTGISVPVGAKTLLFCDGVNVVDQATYFSSLTLGSALPVASGGTGGTSQSAARTGLGLGTISTQDANNVSITGGSATGLTSVSATTITGTSDKRLKEEIYPLFGALERVKKLEGVEFSWKSNKKKSVGLIAQDVEEVFPELVYTDGFGFKSIEYGNLVAVLIEAVKELDRKVSG